MTVLWTAEDLAAATSGRTTRPFAASGVSIDSRTIRPGELFVALTNQRDGHAFVADAMARGAAGALVSRSPDSVEGAPLLVVDDVLRGLTALGRFARARFAGTLVAVTGSVGKTTTKEMLRAVLSAAGPTWAAEASHNNQWGVPLTLARLPRDAAYCVVEIGMNHPGEIAPLSRLARPDVCVITTVERAHVGNLGSVSAIADEKAAIAAGLRSDGIAVLPADSAFLERLRRAMPEAATLTLFGAGDAAASRLIEAHADANGTDVTADIGGARVAFRLSAPGRHMAMNAVAALAAAAALGLDPARAATALARFRPIAGRGARRLIAVTGGEAILLDESYNANAASVRAALAVLALQPTDRRVAVLGDMLELGEHGPAEHASLAPDVVAAAQLLFTCGPLMRVLADAVPARLRGAHAVDSAALAPIVAAAVRPGDAVLVKGSLGSRMRLVVDALGAAA